MEILFPDNNLGVYQIMMIRRGDIFYADLRPVIGSEQGGIRPVLIIQNDVGNKHSPTVICAAITSQIMRNAGLEETQAGIKIAGRNINNLR